MGVLLMFYREADGVFVEGLCGSAPADTIAVLTARVLRDLCLATLGTAWIEFADAGGKAANVLVIEFCAAFGRLLASRLSRSGVCRALLLCLREGLVLDEESLAFVALARPTPLDDDRRPA
jgi:hypothetical protein